MGMAPENIQRQPLINGTIPGELKLMEHAWKKYGKLPWNRLFQPSINLAVNGFNVSNELGIRLKKIENFILSKEESSVWRRDFAPDVMCYIEVKLDRY
jgi:gamma-glutamyltranspeptidase